MRESACKRGYDRRWRKARDQHLKANPLCVGCMSQGIMTPATVVDHIKPHQGDMVLFWDKSNWQSLCDTCHDSHKQSQEKGGQGFNKGCSVDGTPIDPDHPWNK